MSALPPLAVESPREVAVWLHRYTGRQVQACSGPLHPIGLLRRHGDGWALEIGARIVAQFGAEMVARVVMAPAAVDHAATINFREAGE